MLQIAKEHMGHDQMRFMKGWVRNLAPDGTPRFEQEKHNSPEGMSLSPLAPTDKSACVTVENKKAWESRFLLLQDESVDGNSMFMVSLYEGNTNKGEPIVHFPASDCMLRSPKSFRKLHEHCMRIECNSNHEKCKFIVDVVRLSSVPA